MRSIEIPEQSPDLQWEEMASSRRTLLAMTEAVKNDSESHQSLDLGHGWCHLESGYTHR
jgi:hypothetical protein